MSGTLEELYAKCGIPGGFDTGKYRLNTTLSSVETTITTLKEYESSNLVDPLQSLENQRIYIWMGTLDQWISVGNNK